MTKCGALNAPGESDREKNMEMNKSDDISFKYIIRSEREKLYTIFRDHFSIYCPFLKYHSRFRRQ